MPADLAVGGANGGHAVGKVFSDRFAAVMVLSACAGSRGARPVVDHRRTADAVVHARVATAHDHPQQHPRKRRADEGSDEGSTWTHRLATRPNDPKPHHRLADRLAGDTPS